MDARHFSFYTISLYFLFFTLYFYRITYDPFCSIKIKITTHRCKRRVCKRNTLFGQSNINNYTQIYIALFVLRILDLFYHYVYTYRFSNRRFPTKCCSKKKFFLFGGSLQSILIENSK